MSVLSYLLGGIALSIWLALVPFGWWSQKRVPRRASFAKISIAEESFPHFTADGRFAVSAKHSTTLRLMDDGIIIREVPNGNVYWQFNIGPFKYSPTFSPDGKLLVVLTTDGVAHVLDITERRELGKCKLKPLFSALAVSPGGTTLAVKDLSAENDQIILYDVQSGEHKVLAHPCFEILFSPDGSYLAVWDTKSISIIEMRTGKELPSIRLPSSLREVVFSADGQTIFATDDDGTIRKWDIHTGSDRVLLRRPGITSYVRVSANGKALAVGYVVPVEGQLNRLGETVVLDTETGVQMANFQDCGELAFGSDGQTLVIRRETREVYSYLDLWDLPPRARFHWGWTVFLAVVATGLTGAWWWITRK